MVYWSQSASAQKSRRYSAWAKEAAWNELWGLATCLIEMGKQAVSDLNEKYIGLTWEKGNNPGYKETAYGILYRVEVES